MKPATKGLLIGCGGLAAVALAAIVGLGVWIMSAPEGGVKLANEMDPYALDYIAEHNLLDADEELIAYYDATISMDGTEAALLTTSRVVYHNGGDTTSIPIKDIENINHRYESLIGDVIEIRSTTGQVMKIEIAPFNLGETFKNVLMETWQSSSGETTP